MVISVPATPGCERAPITVLQGHLDMVCEKNSDTQHDFDNDPIKLILDKTRRTGSRSFGLTARRWGLTTALGSPWPWRPRLRRR